MNCNRVELRVSTLNGNKKASTLKGRGEKGELELSRVYFEPIHGKDDELSLDIWLVVHLNHWALHERTLVTFLANDIVFLMDAIALGWLAFLGLKSRRLLTLYSSGLRNYFKQAFFILFLPTTVITLLTELFGKFYSRQRPFVGVPGVRAIFSHAADGAMPSHHMVYMCSLATMVYFIEKRLGMTLFLFALISGISRVAAGVHYPSDVIVGAIVGCAFSIAYWRGGIRFLHERVRLELP